MLWPTNKAWAKNMPRLAAPLSDAKFRSLKPKERPYEVSDGARPGLQVEVLPTGRRVWRFRYSLNGARGKVTLGELSLADARKAADVVRDMVARGEDPAAAKRAEKAKGADDEATVAGFFERRFLPDHLAKLRSRVAVEKLLRREVLPHIGRIRVDQVTPDNIESITDRIKDQGHEASAVLTRAWMSSLFELAVDRRRIPANPVKQIKRKRVGKPAVRTRVMTGSELGFYLKALRADADAVSLKHRLALEVILRTACRRGELVKARWEHVDLQAGTWIVPPENQKAAIEHRVFLSDRTAEALETLQALAMESPWVVPADRDPDAHVHPEGLNGARRRLIRDTPSLKALPHFTAHDGRRAFSTWAHDNLEHPDVIEACLGHTIPGVRGIYAKPQFERARRALMQKWADHLDAMTAGNVVPLRSTTAA